MPKVLCKLPNASDLINGVQFVSHKNGMLSVEISDEQAARFCSIPGYEMATKDGPDRAELVAKAESLGVQVDARWGDKRLIAEIAKAEEEAADLAAKNAADADADAKKAAEEDAARKGGTDPNAKQNP